MLSEHYSGEAKESLWLGGPALPSPEQMYDVFMMLRFLHYLSDKPLWIESTCQRFQDGLPAFNNKR